MPDAPGIYLFRRKEKILYIGKATSLRARVKSYFSTDLNETRGPLLVDMIRKADGIDFRKTDSVLEALLLEAELIKKFQPPFNTKEKDDKSFNCVVITNEEFPRVLVIRKKELDFDKLKIDNCKLEIIYGPFPNSNQLKIALKIIRKIFPYRDKCTPCILLEESSTQHSNILQNIGMSGKPCFNRQIGLCPGVCTGEITQKEYQKTIRHLRLFFEGKKKKLLDALSRDMKTETRAEHFEKAGEIKKTIFALRHIQDVALITNASIRTTIRAHPRLRIEAYDIAHISGTDAVGAMVVIEDGTLKKADYRKFKIRGGFDNNDFASLKEVIERRLARVEWPMPGLFVADGGLGQKRIIEEALKVRGLSIPVVVVTKDLRHRPEKISGDEEIIRSHEREILLANAEAHRFAVAFHRNRRDFSFVKQALMLYS